MSHLKIILIAHLVVGLAPVGIAFVPLSVSGLPIIWTLASIGLSQLMLLSIYAGMFTGSARNKLLVATFGIAYIAVFQTIGERLMAGAVSTFSIGGSYLRFVGMDAGIFIVLTIVVACARQAVGSVRRLGVIAPTPRDARPQFSLLSLLMALSIAALVMGLVRSSRLADDRGHAGMMVAQYSLFTVVFGINIVAIVWATLGIGAVTRKLAVVVAVSVILGLSLGVSSSHDTLGWWLLASSSLVTVVPTLIIASTLFSLRPLGFRLTRLPAEAIPTDNPLSEDATEPTDAAEP